MSNRIMLFNPALSTLNLGDVIIFDSIAQEIDAAFPHAFRFEVSTHLPLSHRFMRLTLHIYPRIVCGTNILSSNMRTNKQWFLSFRDAFYLDNLILFGVGWHDYQGKPTWFTRWLLKRILSKNCLHSVRDSYTQQKLESIGITNVINTGCPTLWTLTPEKCQRIPTGKAQNVVFTLTDYRRAPDLDSEIIRILRDNYQKLYFWPQGSEDIEYSRSLATFDTTITTIPPRLDHYDHFLATVTDIDYIGTRLHGGIRAMQHERRCIIIGIDNRAKEKKKDFNITVVDRNQPQEIDKLLNQCVDTHLTLNFDAIGRWRQQLRALATAHT